MARQVVLVAKGNVQLKKDLREKKQDQSLICRFVSFAVGGNRWSLVHVRPLHIMMGLLTKSTIMNPESSFRNVERYTIWLVRICWLGCAKNKADWSWRVHPKWWVPEKLPLFYYWLLELALVIEFLTMTHPKGYVCCLTRSKSFEVGCNVNTFPKTLEVLAMSLAMKVRKIN